MVLPSSGGHGNDHIPIFTRQLLLLWCCSSMDEQTRSTAASAARYMALRERKELIACDGPILEWSMF